MRKRKGGGAVPRVVIETDGKPVDRTAFLAGAIQLLQEIRDGIATSKILGADEFEGDLDSLLRDVPRLAPEPRMRTSQIHDAVHGIERELLALKAALGNR